jgi:hypothetical protein
MSSHLTMMARYFFDVRKGDELILAEESLNLRDLKAAADEATRSLWEIAQREVEQKGSGRIGVEVRDANGPVLDIALAWNLRFHR